MHDSSKWLDIIHQRIKNTAKKSLGMNDLTLISKAKKLGLRSTINVIHVHYTKMKFSIKNFFSKCDQILNGKLHFSCSGIT